MGMMMTFRYNKKDVICERKNNTLSFIKIKNLCSVKDTVKRMKKTTQTRAENIFKIHT